jgi:hypothetical protein
MMSAGKLRFPAIGSVVRVPLFPNASANSPASGAWVDVRIVGGGAAKRWALKQQGIRQRDARRVAELRRGLTKDEAPELFQPRIQDAALALLSLLGEPPPPGPSAEAVAHAVALADAQRALREALSGGAIMTETAVLETSAAEREAISEGLVRAGGMAIDKLDDGGRVVGEIDLETVTDVSELVGYLDALGLTDYALGAVIRAQVPSDRQLLSSGS